MAALALATEDVQALERVSVSAGSVAAAVDHAEHRLDAEAVVAPGSVTPQRRCAAVYVEAVVSRPCDDIAHQRAVPLFLYDGDPINPAPTDDISADKVVGTAD